MRSKAQTVSKAKATRVDRSAYCEDPKAQYLFSGTDETGKKVYFFKMNITGLRNRIFGPYSTPSLAVKGFDTVLGEALQAFCEVTNVHSGRSFEGMEHVALPNDLMPVDLAKSTR
jgi:hypothetical protein